MAAISESDILEKRIGILENLVFGLSDKDTEYPKFAQPETSPVFAKSTNVKCIDALNNVHSKINVSVAGRKNITETFNKLPDLQKYLDPEFADELTITPSAKTEMILAEEDFIMQTASTMQTLKELEPIISSEHVKGAPYFSCKSQMHIIQLLTVKCFTITSEQLQLNNNPFTTITTFPSIYPTYIRVG
ncbi:dynactin subunit 3 [Octopus bimaculoides]|uniref:dynactin subunit 3 n=1 Tax=Octopus bimaculoides TaxID=37653 RepID=UPI0022E7C0BF|nr:dynactin subunit 3 [Octopus bimaculoides]